MSGDPTIYQTTFRTTVYRTDSLSNRQFIEPTVYRTDNFSEPTIYRTDSIQKRQFTEFDQTKYGNFKCTHSMQRLL